jgi:hypothetical protein
MRNDKNPAIYLLSGDGVNPDATGNPIREAGTEWCFVTDRNQLARYGANSSNVRVAPVGEPILAGRKKLDPNSASGACVK